MHNYCYNREKSSTIDHYGRTLAHLFLPDGNNLTAMLLQQGMGIGVSIPPNLKFQDCYRSAESHARQLKLGVWNNTYFNVRAASSTLTQQDTGFRRVQGIVNRVGESKNAFWLSLGEGFTVRLPRNKLSWLPVSPDEFKDKLITLRGWVYYVQKHNKRAELRINLNPPNMLEAIQN